MLKIKRSVRMLAKSVRECLGILIGLGVMCLVLVLLTDKFATSANLFNVVRQISTSSLHAV